MRPEDGWIQRVPTNPADPFTASILARATALFRSRVRRVLLNTCPRRIQSRHFHGPRIISWK